MKNNNPSRLSWDEIQKQYPDRWVFIIEAEEGIPPTIKSGVVAFDAETKKQVIEEALAHPPVVRPHFILFTGHISHPTHEWRLVTILNEPKKTI